MLTARSCPISTSLLLVVLVGCAPNLEAPVSSGTRARPEVLPDAAARELDALLLLMGDRRLHEPYTAARALEGSPETRVALARALGRSLDTRGRLLLEELLLDPETAVVDEAAFGLGLLGDQRAVEPLLRCVAYCPESAGVEAARALGRLGVGFERLVAAVEELEEGAQRRRLVLGLAAFHHPVVATVAALGARDGDRSMRFASAAGLLGNPSPEGLEVARGLARDADPETQRLGILALGRLGTRQDLELLASVATSPDSRVVSAAVQAAAMLVGRGAAAPEAGWGNRVATMARSEEGPRRLAALAAAAGWAREPEVAAALAELTTTGSAWVRHLATLALARGGDRSRAAALVERDRRAADPQVRAWVVVVAATIGADGVVAELARDANPRVRAAAWSQQILAATPQERPALAAQALADPEPVVREVVLEAIERSGGVPLETLAAALETTPSSRDLGVRLAAVRAIAARGAAERLELGGAVLALEGAFRRFDHPTRREATAALARLGRQPPASLGAREVAWGSERYREVLVQGATAPTRYRIATSRGDVELELECDAVALSCHFFRQLAGQGFYDGTLVVSNDPGAAVVFGDPTGDGHGGAGFRVGDEPSRGAVERGVVGLVAASGPDSAAGPLFVALAALPELDGRRALLGRIRQGLEVLEQLEPGDLVLSVTPLG